MTKHSWWPFPTSTLWWCPECCFWTVPETKADRDCRYCGTGLTETWVP